MTLSLACGDWRAVLNPCEGGREADVFPAHARRVGGGAMWRMFTFKSRGRRQAADTSPERAASEGSGYAGARGGAAPEWPRS